MLNVFINFAQIYTVKIDIFRPFTLLATPPMTHTSCVDKAFVILIKFLLLLCSIQKRGTHTVLVLRNIYLMFFLGTFTLGFNVTIKTRSHFRKSDPTIPSVIASWQDAPQEQYVFRNSRLEEHAVFKTFDEVYFFAHQLPQHAITYRYNPKHHVDGTVLRKLVNQLIDEIHAGKRRFTNFTAIKDCDFNYTKRIGLMVLRFNEYPFIVKLFMEHPQSLTSQYNKGFAPLCCFYMSGGINRHLIGFTRLKNLDFIRTKIATEPSWAQKIDTPRKWFFMPDQTRWIQLTGFNIGNKKQSSTRLPGTYCIIADKIETNTTTSMFNKRDSQTCLNLCKFLDFAIDPHIANFMWEKGTNKLVLIDTENFRAMVGFRHIKDCNNYFDWYMHLAEKFISDTYFRSKKDLQALHKQLSLESS